jgi:hypothetical protein
LSITVTVEVGKTRILGDYSVTSAKYQPQGRKYPQYIDLKWKADEAPALIEGDEIGVTFKYLPDARGWESNRTREDGKPYINANVVLYDPDIAVASSAEPEPEYEDDIPF